MITCALSGMRLERTDLLHVWMLQVCRCAWCKYSICYVLYAGIVYPLHAQLHSPCTSNGVC